MKKITLWLFALFTCWQISAQTGTIVIGVNDGTPNTAINNPSPMQDYYKTGRVQFLYTASELLGAGLVAGDITEIGWVVTSNNASTLQEGYTISMKSTASTVLTANFESGSTVVYGPTDFTPSSTGNVMFTLTTPFTWDGTSNVIVDVCAGSSTGTYTQNVSCANSTTTGIQAVVYGGDSSTSPCTEATGIAMNDRPLLVATGNIASCLAPLNLVSANVTANTADISWNATSSTPLIGYEYVVSTSNVAPTGAGVATTNTYASISSLLPQTTYYVFVRSNCTAGEFSGWYGPISFTTYCASVTSFVQNFDAVTAPDFPNCWAHVGNGGYTSTQNYTANSNPNTLQLVSYSTNSLALVSLQQVSNLGAGTNRIKFDMRASYDVGGVIEFGYLTNPLDESTFVSLTSFTASNLTYTSYQYSPPAGTYSDHPAFRHIGNPGYSVLIDNIVWELNPTCPDQTGLTVSDITSSGANTSWDPVAAGVEYAVTTSATPPASGTPTTATYYIASGLAPQTVHYLHVRTDCGAGDYGVWVTIPFTTQCVSITTLPWIENFDAVTTTPDFPPCWSEENGDWQTSNSIGYNSPRSGANYLRDFYGATNEFMWTPGFDLVAGTSYDFSSWIQGDGGSTWTVDFYVNNVQNSTGATQLGLQYVVPGDDNFVIQPYFPIIRTFVPATSGTYYFAFRVNEPTYGAMAVAFDDVELKLSPTTPPACATNLVATPNATCGNFTNNLTWDIEPAAAGYYVTIGTTSGGNDIANAVNIALNSYSFTGAIGTQYFWKVIPYNAAGPAIGCTEQLFSTLATGCYCTSVPAINDGLGITTAIIGSSTNPIADITYTDLTATPEIIAQGENANVQLTFSTGWIYKVNIWIDFNNDYDFDDAGELVKTGIASTSDQPNTVDASFVMPMTAPTGVHRMRIGSAWGAGQTPPNPCFNGSYGVTVDFTVDTVVLSSESFDKSTFVAYPNPVKDVLNLSYKTAISNVRVINLLGQEVLNTKTNTNEVQVNMSTLNTGAYIVNVTVDDTIHTIKVIKE